METCMTSGRETSSSVGFVAFVDGEDAEFQMKAVKKEEDEDDLCGERSDSVERISPVDAEDGAFQVIIVKEEEDEDYLYCEECRSSFLTQCEVHGPALFISDSPVPVRVTEPARRTLPSGLEVRTSGIPGVGLGVFNTGETVPVGAHFGPYQGEMVDKEEAMNSRYSWVIYKRAQNEEYIDATREAHANWMRYVNCARNGEENNLVVFQYRGGILYRCCRPIKPGEELLLWYDDKYAKDIGPAFDCLWNNKCSTKERNDAVPEEYICPWCPFSYAALNRLQKHILSMHSEECVRLQKSEDTRHEDQISTGSSSDVLNIDSCHERVHKIYQCSDCGKTFSYPSHLKKHRRVHTGEKPFVCSQCGMSFTERGSLRHHQFIHTGEKPYQCSQCDKSFTQPSNLKRHQLLHTGEKPYCCSLCGRNFSNQSGLQSHERIHTRDKPYRCSYCGRSFAHQNSFRRHQRIHAGEKP